MVEEMLAEEVAMLKKMPADEMVEEVAMLKKMAAEMLAEEMPAELKWLKRWQKS